MLLIFILLFLISFLWALWSMRDFGLPKEILNLINRLKLRGTILFLKKKVIHYSSSSKFSSSSGTKER